MYLEPCRQLFSKKNPIIDVRLGSKYTSGNYDLLISAGFKLSLPQAKNFLHFAMH